MVGSAWAARHYVAVCFRSLSTAYDSRSGVCNVGTALEPRRCAFIPPYLNLIQRKLSGRRAAQSSHTTRPVPYTVLYRTVLYSALHVRSYMVMDDRRALCMYSYDLSTCCVSKACSYVSILNLSRLCEGHGLLRYAWCATSYSTLARRALSSHLSVPLASLLKRAVPVAHVDALHGFLYVHAHRLAAPPTRAAKRFSTLPSELTSG